MSAAVFEGAPAGVPSAEARPVQLRLELDGFEGPLELLLTLIEHHRLPITRVSLAQVADQYLAQVRALPEPDPDLLADFLAIGGRLLLLKSRALLLAEPADAGGDDPGEDLELRLREYRVFRAAALRLQQLELLGWRSYTTRREPQVSAALAPLAPLPPDALAAAWRRLLQARPRTPVELPLETRASVDERRATILDLLRRHARLSFAALAGRTLDEVVATFLAVLELYRRGQIAVDQPEPFGDLLIAPLSAVWSGEPDPAPLAPSVRRRPPRSQPFSPQKTRIAGSRAGRCAPR